MLVVYCIALHLRAVSNLAVNEISLDLPPRSHSAIDLIYSPGFLSVFLSGRYFSCVTELNKSLNCTHIKVEFTGSPNGFQFAYVTGSEYH